MRASPEQINQMQRFTMKLLLCVMAITAAAAAVPLYMLHDADQRARIAAAPIEQPDNAPVVR